MAYDVGQTYQTTIDVTDTSTGEPANPDQAVLTVSWWNAAGQQTSVFALNPTAGQGQLPAPDPVGHLAFNWTFTEAALYKFAWATTGPGAVSAASSDYQSCREYIAALSLAEAASWVGVADKTQMPKLRGAVALATRLVEKITGPTVPRLYTNDWISGVSKPVIKVPHPPLVSANAVLSVASTYDGGPTWSGVQPGDIIVNPRAGTLRLRSGMDWWYGPWLATYTAGRAEVTDDIEGGVKETLWDLWSTQRYIFGDTQEPSYEDVATLEARLPPGWALPARAMEMLAGETMPGFG